jgi:hypothetical protein
VVTNRVKAAFDAEDPGGLPEIVTVYVPTEADGETVIVMNAEVPEATGVIVLGLNDTDTPEEKGETEPASVTAWAMPAVSVAVTIELVLWALEPRITLPLGGLTERL